MIQKLTPDRGGRSADGCDRPEPSIDQRMLGDAMHRADDQRDDAKLHAQEKRFQQRLLQVQLRVKPREAKHEQQARQHESQAG